MSTRLVFRGVADADLSESAEWYEVQQPGLGFDFIDHVQIALDAIAEDPLRNPIVHGDIRDGVVTKFPFAVY
jgi:hypothetical protein